MTPNILDLQGLKPQTILLTTLPLPEAIFLLLCVAIIL